MTQTLLRLFTSLIIATAVSLIAYGQGNSTSSLSGTVVDPTGAVVPNATVTAKSNATGAEFRAATADNGTFSIPALDAGTYTVIISAAGFKQAVVNDVKLDAGVPATVRVGLEVGAANETVTVQGGGEVVQTQTANITTTLNVNQISNLPLVSRNPVNFIVLLSGVSTPTNNRASTINGLPTSAIDITLDGINIQDNFQKSTDGFFTRVPPSLDSVEEVTVSTATPEAQGGALGAVQIKFVTRGGTNEFHGSLYEYHRNPWLNSAYWFTNRDTRGFDVATGQFCQHFSAPTSGEPYDPEKCKAQRARVLFNQYGGRIGGPIRIPKLFDGRNKAFFFVNYEEFRQPSQVNRQRTILSPQAQQGIFRYGTNGSVDLLQLAQRAMAAGCVGCTTDIDPVIKKLLADIRNATNNTGGITQLTDPNLQRFTYNPSGFSTNKKPTVRFDFQLTDKHRVEATWSYLDGRGGPDFLNNVEPHFPGFPNQGSQPADRYTGSLAVRSTLTPTLVNEARAGLSGGPSRFNPTASAADFSGTVANQAGFNLGGAPGNNATGIAAAIGIDGATATSAPSRRNPLFRDLSDTLNWTRGAHGLTLGGKFTWLTLTFNQQTLVPTINFGVDTNDPANALFTTANFPNASSTDLNNAKGLYAVLTGRVIAINANARLDEKTGNYKYLGNAFERGRQKELGFFAQDSWRMRPNLTLNYGLRWEVQGAFYPLNSNYTTTTLADLFGVSGPGNLFKPGTLAGRVTQFVQYKEGERAYHTDYKNFAPSLGFAWSPNAKQGWLKRFIGDSGQTVVRGGYSIAYNRRGINEGFRNIFSGNPGVTITTNRDLTSGTLVPNPRTDLPVLLRETNRLGPPAFPTTPAYPLTGSPFVAVTNSANIFDPNIKVPYVQSWSFGLQREITKDMAVEVRYVGNRFLRGWTTYNLNSVENNVLENGLLNEFKLAQANLLANNVAGGSRAGSFAYFGPSTGTSPLPIALAYLTGNPLSAAGNQALYSNASNSPFRSSNLVNSLAPLNPNVCCSATASFSGILDNSATFRTNASAAGLAANFMLTNPGLRGGANFTGNGGYSRYDALQVDLRRRLSRGLLVQANYTFAKGFAGSRALINGSQGTTANPTQFSFRAPWNNALNTDLVNHAFKVNWVYELPLGRGKMLFGHVGTLLDRLIGGWEFDGTARVQSGQVLDFGSVNLVGMTRKELQGAFKIRQGVVVDLNGNPVLTNGQQTPATYSLPHEIIANTIRAFSVNATGYSNGAPTGRYLAPAGGPNCIQVYAGQCAPQNTFVTGPKFTRFDLSLVKRTKLTERLNFELRGEFLNAFNHVNFFGIAGANLFSNNVVLPTFFTSQNFGQVTTAYTDSSGTQDPGGRLIQLVARFNF